MTEEDQKLVALAALHGARFVRRDRGSDGMMWATTTYPETTKWTVGRAAEFYLYMQKLRTNDEHSEYSQRTNIGMTREIDAEFVAQVLA